MKTVPTKNSVKKYIAALSSPRREQSEILLKLFSEVTKEEPVLWGDSIIGFGTYDYTYASGRSGTWMRVGFSPRKTSLSVYLTCSAKELEKELEPLGNPKTGVGCIYLKSLDDIDMNALKRLVKTAYNKTKHGETS